MNIKSIPSINRKLLILQASKIRDKKKFWSINQRDREKILWENNGYGFAKPALAYRGTAERALKKEPDKQPL